MSGPLLEARELTRVCGHVQALRGADFVVNERAAVAPIGCPITMAETPSLVRRRPPVVGPHPAEVLDAESVQALLGECA
ncbi:hypothetical protein [Flindersiella endophytica]